MDVAPSAMTIIQMFGVITKRDTRDIFLTVESFEGFDYSRLGLPLREVIGYQSCAYLELGGVARALVFGEANFESLGLVSKPVTKNILPCLFGSKRYKREVFGRIGLSKR